MVFETLYQKVKKAIIQALLFDFIKKLHQKKSLRIYISYLTLLKTNCYLS